MLIEKTSQIIALRQLRRKLRQASDISQTLEKDLTRWGQSGIEKTFLESPEFRSLFYYRLYSSGKSPGWLLHHLKPGVPTLYINTPEIGPGLFIQHGFATIISALKIGHDCWINQQVTIGYSSQDDCPVIGNNVTINAGALVIGGIHIGDHAIIGAGAVVVKSVPARCTVVGNPARIIKRGDVPCNDKL